MHLVNDLLVHQREAVGRLAQLSAKRTPVRVPESRLSNLRVDPQSVVVANACAARLSISFVVNDTAELEVDPAPSSTSTFTSDETAWVWLGLCMAGLAAKSADCRENTKSL